MNLAASKLSWPIAGGFNLLAIRRWWLGIDRNEHVVRWGQTQQGQFLIHIIFFLLLFATPFLREGQAGLIIVTLMMCAILPAQRMILLGIVGAMYFLVRPFRFEISYSQFSEIWTIPASAPVLFQLGMSISAMIFLIALYLFTRGQQKGKLGKIGQRPVVFLSLLTAIATALTLLIPTDSLLFSISWSVLAILASSFFFVAYIVADYRSKKALPFAKEMGFVRPVWPAGIVPIKSPIFLRKFEANTPEELVQTRLKALKLIVWAVVLYLLWEVMFNHGLYGVLDFPRLDQTMMEGGEGRQQSFVMRWLILAAFFLAELLKFGADLHLMIAIVKMAGFNVPLCFNNPLSSRSLTEYWGRYYFYFKEMLADLFFFPTFQRCFRKSPKLRIAFATIVAAFFGNILFDLIPRLPEVSFVGVMVVLEQFYSYFVYAALLTAGLIVSQLRKKKARPEDGWFFYNVLSRIQVAGFFMLLEVFDDSSGIVPLGERTLYFFSLFNPTLSSSLI